MGIDPAPARREPANPGDRFGPFRVVRLLGRGGLSCVYLAEQEQPVRRKVAIKVPAPGLEADEFIRRFHAEQKVVAVLNHPNIVKLLAADITPEGQPWCAMEYVAGAPLTEFCATRRLDLDARLRLFVQACSAVNHVHERGLLHRNIKPRHLMVEVIDDQPVLRMTGFVIAQPVHMDLADPLFVAEEEGQLVGTPTYMSPEQWTGSGIDRRSDIYALGLVLYHVLTGSHPFTGTASTTQELLQAKQRGTPRPSERAQDSPEALRIRPAVWRELDRIVLQATAPDPASRHQTARALAEDLESVLARRPGPAVLLKALLALVVIALACLVLWYASRGRATDDHTVRGPGESLASAPALRPTYTASRALLIGVSYAGSGDFEKLPNAEGDVAAIADALVAVDPTWRIRKLLGDATTGQAIMRSLGVLKQEAETDDRVLIYFAGHGQRLPSNEESGWILPADARRADHDIGRASWIRFEEFLHFFREAKAKHILVALDCCYAGRITRLRSPDGPAPAGKYLERRARVVIASGRANEQVPDGPAGSHSPFARAFVDALGGDRTTLTATGLFARIQQALQASSQAPQMRFVRDADDPLDDGDFVLLR